MKLNLIKKKNNKIIKRKVCWKIKKICILHQNYNKRKMSKLKLKIEMNVKKKQKIIKLIKQFLNKKQ